MTSWIIYLIYLGKLPYHHIVFMKCCCNENNKEHLTAGVEPPIIIPTDNSAARSVVDTSGKFMVSKRWKLILYGNK